MANNKGNNCILLPISFTVFQSSNGTSIYIEVLHPPTKNAIYKNVLTFCIQNKYH